MDAKQQQSAAHPSSEAEHGRYRQALGERIRHIRESVFCESRSAFSARFMVSLTTMQNYESGLREPGSFFLKELAETAGVTLDWLVKGEGPERASNASEAIAAQGAVAASLNSELLATVIEDVDSLLESAGMSMQPAKRAMIYAFVYNSYQERTGKLDLLTLLKLAA